MRFVARPVQSRNSFKYFNCRIRLNSICSSVWEKLSISSLTSPLVQKLAAFAFAFEQAWTSGLVTLNIVKV